MTAIERLREETDHEVYQHTREGASMQEVEAKLASERTEWARMVAEREAERDWMRRRATRAGHFSCDDRRDWGRSSNALAEFALGGKEPGELEFPSDMSDLAACERCYRGAPAHLRERMVPVLEKYRAHVEGRYPGAIEMVRTHIDAEDA